LIDNKTPDFHLPQFFGKIIFSKWEFEIF
jgi:hypothetical protein